MGKAVRKRPRIFSSIACLVLAALCFSFSAESLGPIIITAFSDHSHEAKVLHERGKTRLILVHDHDFTESVDSPSPIEHPDHKFEFLDQDMPCLLAASSETFSVPALILTHPSLSRLVSSPVIKPVYHPHAPRPRLSLIQVRSVVILV